MEDILKLPQSWLPVLLLLGSCSWYRNLERSLVEDEQKQMKQRTVPREQYDQLLVKYEELSKKYQDLKGGAKAEKSVLAEELQSASAQNFSNTAPAPSSDTVDVFASEVSQAPAASVAENIEAQISLFKKAQGMKDSDPGQATKLFQQLETEGVPAVKARAKFQLGEIMFSRGQYDLSLQIFEDLIAKHAHSGMVLDSLRYAVQCTDKLGLESKKTQYSSLLNEIFEAQ